MSAWQFALCAAIVVVFVVATILAAGDDRGRNTPQPPERGDGTPVITPSQWDEFCRRAGLHDEDL